MAQVAVIGGGPAGLMAAEVIAASGCAVTVVDHMRSPGRKFLVAGRGGLNLTHSEPLEQLLHRCMPTEPRLTSAIEAFPPAAVRAWCESLGQETFVGSSGRVFPRALRATPLLRAWLQRLDDLDVRFLTRRRFDGWDGEGRVRLTHLPGPSGSPELPNAADEAAIPTATERVGTNEILGPVDAVVLALGGASWPRTGSDGGWVDALRARGVAMSPLEPANSGFSVPWTAVFAERFAGFPLKNVAVTFGDRTVRGELMVTENGLEGGPVYALSHRLRDATRNARTAVVTVDLRADLPEAKLVDRLSRPRGSQSTTSFLRKAGGLTPAAIGMLREAHPGGLPIDPTQLAALVKAAPITVLGPSAIARAISTAGGVSWGEIDDDSMLRRIPGVFVCGEMLDWEAPTGGYLLQATFSTAVAAAEGVLRQLASR